MMRPLSCDLLHHGRGRRVTVLHSSSSPRVSGMSTRQCVLPLTSTLRLNLRIPPALLERTVVREVVRYNCHPLDTTYGLMFVRTS